MMKTILKISSILMGCLTTAMATKYLPPEDQIVKSQNGQYHLDISAKTGQHEIRKGKELLWSFNRRVRYDDYYLSNDGKFVLWAAEKYVQIDDVEKNEAVAVYSSEGLIMKKTFAEVSKPRAYREGEIGPIGDIWRIWRSKVNREEDVISIAVEGKKEGFKIDLAKMGEQGKAEQAGTGQPATRPVDEPEGGEKPQPEAEGRSQ
jgi:hypothetical protein